MGNTSLVRSSTTLRDEDSYTELAFYDNWYHVRKLIQALRFLMGCNEDDLKPEELKQSELHIRNLLVAIQGGVENSTLPCMLTLDHVLRNIWRAC
jgi:hypothetical protein